MEHSPRFLKLCEAIRPHIKEVSTNEVAARIARAETFYLVDVREESEFASDRIAGAIHIGKGVLERDIEKTIADPGADIVLYCGGGFRSAIAAENLGRMGYTNVASMVGGFREWKSKNLPLE
ncbi:MAG: rhodanese-like domain-containing protein [Polyangiaceae bacterium]|nr:rhodanese-like domain-containing protein [Polyangiaceae bacterium]